MGLAGVVAAGSSAWRAEAVAEAEGTGAGDPEGGGRRRAALPGQRCRLQSWPPAGGGGELLLLLPLLLPAAEPRQGPSQARRQESWGRGLQGVQCSTGASSVCCCVWRLPPTGHTYMHDRRNKVEVLHITSKQMMGRDRGRGVAGASAAQACEERLKHSSVGSGGGLRFLAGTPWGHCLPEVGQKPQPPYR